MYKWMKKGTGEILGFTLSMGFLLPLIFVMMGTLSLYTSLRMVDFASQSAARAAIVCEDKSSAERAAASKASKVLSSLPAIGAVNASVDYVPGSRNKWEKGSFVYVTVTAHVHSSVPTLSGNKRGITMMMVERKSQDAAVP